MLANGYSATYSSGQAMIRRRAFQMWPKIILFGDSHTQRSFDPNNGCWGSLLADRLQRVCDVVPRGFSGYNTRWCRLIMPKVFEQFDSNQIACVTILLGSNDSVPECSQTGQHVPVDEYKTNLMSMIDYLSANGIGASKIILMAPPNFNQDDFNRWCISQNRMTIPENWKNEIVHYANAAKFVAAQKQVSLVDLYQVFTKEEDNTKLFNDGLHLSRKGGQLLYDNLLPLVVEKIENFIQKPLNNSAMQYPYWMDIDSKNPSNSFN